jgi:phage regulator Rha-like protein
MTSHKMVDSNIRNASLSTGPKTDAGKAISRTNAETHGLTSTIIVEDEHFLERFQAFADSLKPKTLLGVEALKKWVLATIKVEKCENEYQLLRQFHSERANWLWAVDREDEANKLFKKLARDPMLTAGQLQQTAQGCELLLDQWQTLEEQTLKNGKLTQEEKSMASDLLGVPPIFRDTHSLLNPPLSGNEADLKATLLQTIEGEIARLEDLLERLQRLDVSSRQMAIAGYGVFDTEDGRRFQRYEREWNRRLDKAMKEYELAEQGKLVPMPYEPKTQPQAIISQNVVPTPERPVSFVPSVAPLKRVDVAAPKPPAPHRNLDSLMDRLAQRPPENVLAHVAASPRTS